MFAVLRLGSSRRQPPLRFRASALPSLPCGPQRVRNTETWQMTRFIDLTGQTFGRLIASKRVETDSTFRA